MPRAKHARAASMGWTQSQTSGSAALGVVECCFTLDRRTRPSDEHSPSSFAVW